tara:strand:+ start:635 stop:1618 length:984 start_codon:yes stop_codon:yes gene_type:complete
MSYRVGVSEAGRWVFVTDGLKTFWSKTDIRHHRYEPKYKISYNGMIYAHEKNILDEKVIEFSNEKFDMHKYCYENRINIMGGEPENTLKSNILKLVGFESVYNQERMANLFENMKKVNLEWKELEGRIGLFDEIQRKLYLKAAQENWNNYYRFQNVENVDLMSGIEFEIFVSYIMEKREYIVEMTSSNGDFGVDILATKGGERVAVQVKRYSGSVGVKAVQEVSSGKQYYDANKALVITNSYFTEPAIRLAKKLDVKLVDREKLKTICDRYKIGQAIAEFSLEKYELKSKFIEDKLDEIDKKIFGKNKYNAMKIIMENVRSMYILDY